MSNKLAKDDTLLSLVTANNSIAKDSTLQSINTNLNNLVSAINTSNANSSGGGATTINTASGAITIKDSIAQIDNVTGSNPISSTNCEVTINAGGEVKLSATKDTPITITGGDKINVTGGIVSADGVPISVSTGDIFELFEDTTILSSDTVYTRKQLYRGKNIGETITDEQSAAIREGSFNRIWIGDYWEKFLTYSYTDTAGATQNITQLTRFVVADIDYYYNRSTDQHHVLVIPEWPLYTFRMNASNTTTGAYTGSEMYTKGLKSAENIIKQFFGDSHVLRHSPQFPSSMRGSEVGGYIQVNNRIADLLNANMVYGDYYDSKTQYGNMNKQYLTHLLIDPDHEQLALFKLNSKWRRIETSPTNSAYTLWWLRDPYATTYFINVDTDGEAYYNNASNVFAVRPLSLIY